MIIKYKGKQYNSRQLYVDKNRGTVTIAQLALDEAMGPIKDKAAKEIDKGIAYYANEDEFLMPDDELRQMLYGPIKDKKK